MPSLHPLRIAAVVGATALIAPLSACSDGAATLGETLGEQSSAITPISGCDYSFARPSPSSLTSMGYTFAARYLSGDPGGGKDITKAEATSLTGAGMDVVLVWETTGMDALNGYNAGVSDAQAANSEAAAVGAPATRPIYFALDFDEQASQSAAVDEYFKGVASVIGLSRTGAYGGYYAINQLFDAGLITFGWQTYAWSGGTWDSRAQLRQTANGLDNDEIDADSGMVADFGQWGPNAPSGTAEYAAAFVSQSFPFAVTALDMVEGQTIPSYIELKNVGTKTWDSNTHLGTTQPRDRTSVFADSSWLSPNRPAGVTGTVPPGGTYKFQFNLHAPSKTGTYLEYFGVVEDGVAWFSDPGQGGPVDNDLEAQIVVSAAPDAGHAGGDGGTPAGDGGEAVGEGGVEGDAAVDAGAVGDAGGGQDAGVRDAGKAHGEAGVVDARAPGQAHPGSATHGSDDGGDATSPSTGGGCSVAGEENPSFAPFFLVGLGLLVRRKRAVREVRPRG
jgi:hypothetical protein